jgi:hypothetical protein
MEKETRMAQKRLHMKMISLGLRDDAVDAFFTRRPYIHRKECTPLYWTLLLLKDRWETLTSKSNKKLTCTIEDFRALGLSKAAAKRLRERLTSVNGQYDNFGPYFWAREWCKILYSQIYRADWIREPITFSDEKI